MSQSLTFTIAQGQRFDIKLRQPTPRELDSIVPFISVTAGANQNFLVANQPVTSGTLIALVEGSMDKYSVTNAQHALGFYGVAVNGANPGQLVQVKNKDVIEIPGWGLSPGSVYQAGPAGQLTTSPTPGAVFAHVIGKALTPDKLLISNQSIISI